MAEDSQNPNPDTPEPQLPVPRPANGAEPAAASKPAADASPTPAPSEPDEQTSDNPPSKSTSTNAETAPQSAEPADSKATKRRAKREKVQRRAKARESVEGEAVAATAADSAASPTQKKAAKRRAKLDKAHAAVHRETPTGSRRKKSAILGSTLIVVLSATAVTAGSLYAPTVQNTILPSAVTSLPAGDSIYTCPAVPQLLRGVDGTDPQFAPGAEDVSTTIRSAVVSDLAKRIPGSSLGPLGEDTPRQLTDRLDDAEASEARGSDDQGLTGRSAAVQNSADLDPLQVLRIQPLGELPSIGSGIRSYQAQDGDLAGLAASTCVAAESTWRFTGLQTTTGASSVLQLANPTATTAQVSLELRGADGLIDTSTLQELVIAPGASRAIVIGGYAQGQESVSATVRSVGGKVTASVQQSALRGLTPSGVDFVAANAPAATTQVIPGVWIDEKSNIDQLTAGDGAGSLVPQLHVSATGSEGAGYTIKVLNANGEVAVDLGTHHAASSDATSVVDLRALAAGHYSIVVESDNPVTAAVRMVRGQNPEDSSDTAWAVSSRPLSGNQVVPLAAQGNATFSLAAPQGAASVNAIVISADGRMADTQTLDIPAGTSRTFNPRDISEDAAAVLFQGDSNAYLGQSLLGADRSVSWAPMPPATASRDGIVVNVVG